MKRKQAPQIAIASLVLLSGLGGITRLRYIRIGTGAGEPWTGIIAAAIAVLFMMIARLIGRAPPLGDRRLALAGAAVVLGAAASIPGARLPALAAAGTAMRAFDIAFLLAAIAAARSPLELERVLAPVAAILIATQVALFATGLLLPGHPGFQLGAHQHLPLVARFYGTGGNPFYCGVLMVACAGLAQGLSHHRLRRACTGAALVIAALTLSFVTLVLPIVLAWPLTARFVAPAARARRWRIAIAAGTIAIASLVLYVHPLSARIGGRAIPVGTLHPRYVANARAQEVMPIHDVGGPSLGVELHFTAYFYLARRALGCFADHPLGVGAGNFPATCPIPTMSTYGVWSLANVVHNDYLEQLAEGGTLSVVALIPFALLLYRRRRPPPENPWARGVLVTYLACGLASAVCFRLPFLALLATQIVPAGPLASNRRA